MGTEKSTELSEKWARKIAAEVDPEREAIAAMMLEAYRRGGKQRKQLFEPLPTPGGFLPDGGVSLLPFAYLAISAIATGLVKFCNAGGPRLIAEILSAWKHWLDISSSVEKSKKEEKEVPESLSESQLSLRRIMDELQRTLLEEDLPTEQCELISYRVMRALLREPEEAAQFVTTFQEENQ